MVESTYIILIFSIICSLYIRYTNGGVGLYGSVCFMFIVFAFTMHVVLHISKQIEIS